MNTVKHKKVNEVKELEKSKIHITIKIIDVVPHSVLSRTIIKKTRGNVTVSSFAAREELAEKYPRLITIFR
jgi:hypothetical protein